MADRIKRDNLQLETVRLTIACCRARNQSFHGTSSIINGPGDIRVRALLGICRDFI